ncbi:DUF481 domain-containing protein [Litoribacter ruber]|uniref:DUF481 domain-containing protein n=1 Tax=Litoribacter ruber TaxID=702568 RepID=UPI001FECDC42|nr:DUF481 domain-containing protein [Litoribacter ruber]
MKKAILLFLFLCPLFANAQILNIERLRMEKDTARSFMVKTTFGLNVFNRSAAADEPVNLFGYNLDVNAIYYPSKHATILVSKFDYLRINDSDFLNFGFLHGRVNWYRDRKLNYETYAQYSFDNFRRLDPRWVFGGGIRNRLVDSNRLTLTLGIGALYEYERWQHPETEQFVEVDFVKSSNYVSLRYTINQYVDINTVNYYQVGYDQTISRLRNRVSSSTILNTKFTDKLSFTNSFDISYEDRPIIPITNVIFSFRTGLSLDF